VRDGEHHRAAAPVSAPPAASSEQSSALTSQNDLFARGLALRKQGDGAGALRTYEELIERFPKSPLAENAMAQRMRLLAAGKDARAASEAKRYLSSYPHGFAAGEATLLATQ
jgi:outer membrane protein assembly factor BamD (BamD/ComL family)